MTINFKYNVIHSVINIVPLCGEMIELSKEKKKILAKDKWGIPDVPLFWAYVIKVDDD